MSPCILHDWLPSLDVWLDSVGRSILHPVVTIGSLLNIIGEVDCEHDLIVEGRLEGRVTVRDATLTIAESADVDADLRAPRIIVQGRVRGAIFASERIELAASAVVEGSLSSDRIAIAEGAHFSGSLDMGRRTIAAKVAEYRARDSSTPLART
jgi:cytoskeletal protein CcmA (bactofilin family)